MFKEQKNNTVVLALVAVLAILLVTPTAKAELDIDLICITSYKSHMDGVPGISPWRFEIWVYVVDPGNLDYINVYKPGASIPFATIYEEGPIPRWGDYDSPASYSSLTNLMTDYPNGVYTFEFYDSSHVLLRTVALDYSSLSIPGNPVDFTYPSVDGQTGIPTYPTLTWTVDSGDGDALMMGLEDGVSYRIVPASITTTSWTPGPLQPYDECHLEVSVCTVKDWAGGPAYPTDTVDGDEFQYSLMIEYLNVINFYTASIGLSGWIFMPPGVPDIGYSLDEADLLYFYSSEPVLTYNITTGQWVDPVGWIYINWPFLYELATNSLMFALPPVSGLWVYHFSTGQWEVLPRIIPW